MKRAFLCFSLAVILAPLPAQEFLASKDYIYGVASHSVESKADSLALLSFTKCVNVKVSCVSTYSVEETKLGITENYKNDAIVVSNIDVSGLRKHVEFIDGKYTVYYYLNKKEYVENCLFSYHENMDKALLYENSNEPHAKNLYLGYLYLAYRSISNEMLEYFFPIAEAMRGNIIEKISSKYATMGYLLSARNVGEENPNKTFLVRDENAKILPGFEYCKTDGKWDIPITFLNDKCRACGINNAKWAYIHYATKEYRFIFEIEYDYGRIKINIPDEFYDKISEPRYFYF